VPLSTTETLAGVFVFVGCAMLGVISVPVFLVYRRRASVVEDFSRLGRRALVVAGVGAGAATSAPFALAVGLLSTADLLAASQSPYATAATWLVVWGLLAMVGGVVVATADLLRNVVAGAGARQERLLARAGAALAAVGGAGVVFFVTPSTRASVRAALGPAAADALAGALAATFVGGAVLRWVR
jgi:hypothetical protein